MGPWRPDPAAVRAIDQQSSQWSQGDAVVGAQEFLHLAALSQPLTPESQPLAPEADPGEPTTAVLSAVEGLVVLTQTCDLVRSCDVQPYFEVAPLIRVDDPFFGEVRAARRPGYAYVPGLAPSKLVADLHRVMTLEKTCLLGWDRQAGCLSDADRRDFARALARKRERFAFPDDFVRLSKKAQDRMRSKHDKDSEEGQVLRALREIRVTATPSWDAERVSLLFWFIRHEGAGGPPNEAWARWVDTWLQLMPPQGRFQDLEPVVSTLADMTAQDYVESDPFDMDHLSA